MKAHICTRLNTPENVENTENAENAENVENTSNVMKRYVRTRS